MPPEASLIVIWNPPGPEPGISAGVRFSVPTQEIYLGRYGPTEGINLTLPSHAVSRYHTCLIPFADKWCISDLNSRNHTFLNAERVGAGAVWALVDGNVITICDYRFLFATEPFDRRWLTSDVVPLARGIREDRAWDRLGILGDALQDAGCEWEPFLTVCSSAGNLISGAWVIDYLLREAGDLPSVPSPLVQNVDETAREARLRVPTMFSHIQPAGSAAGV